MAAFSEFVTNSPTPAQILAQNPIGEETVMKIDLNDPLDFTLENVRRMIASASDRTHTQIRVTKAGIAYISTQVGAEDTDDVAFRAEIFSADSDYVGEAASSDDAWVRRVYDLLDKNWPNPTCEYVDEF